jgi:hypothetical protein
MDVVSHCAFPVGGRAWTAGQGSWFYTFVCKATFTLQPGKLVAAAEQQPVHEVDRPWSDTIHSLYAAADLAPRKPRADVVLIGNAYAPAGATTTKLRARLAVGEIDKTIEVRTDGTLQRDGSWLEGAPFTSLPLLYERAAGGPGTDNPVGVPFAQDAQGSIRLPNLLHPGASLGRDAPVKPIGFGPLAARWPSRWSRLGRHADGFNPDAWYDKPLPQDFDHGFFNAAPVDQQLTALRPDERLTLDNLHPRHAQLTAVLPGIRLRAKVSAPAGERTVDAIADSLWIDTARSLCCVTFRGQIALTAGAYEPGWIVVTTEASDAEIASSPAAPAPVVPTARASRPPVRADTVIVSSFREPDSGVPFKPATSVSTGGSQALATPLTVERPATPPPVFPPVAAAPPLVSRPPDPLRPPMLAPAVADSPWAMGAKAGGLAAVGTAPPVAARPPVAETRPPEPRPSIAPATAVRPATKERIEPVDLVFFDREALPRVRRVPAWKKLIQALDDRELDPEEDDPAEAKEPGAIEDKREVLEILLRAEASDAAGIDEALGRGTRDDGRFFQPLALVVGELATPFDEIENLKATMTTVAPLTGNDENLRATIEVAKEFLKLPGLSSSPQVADGLTGRVRDAFNAAKRQVPPGYLDTQTERALVDQRHYQKRKVLGGVRQRALFSFGAGSSSTPLCAYLPEDAAAKLPLFARFKARMVVRVHPPLDQHEQGPALEVLALARVCAVPKRG